jgi:hypothetical protein
VIDQEGLKRLLHYNPATGVFTWLVSPSRNVKAGDIAGTDKEGYTLIRLNRKPYRAHHLVWLYLTGEWPKKNLDHINGVKNDNRWVNLREATHQQNMFNKSSVTRSSSKYKGVYLHKLTNKWSCRINIGKKQTYIGLFETEEEAALAYNKQAIRHHGEYAKLNEVQF